ncbi:MAG: GNAT family N-acetyltransferase [Ochrobactrum anthropi]|uniref:GNAT family N-acetyltransferase n=1 Tax=Brucella anthropi TaxID=529 RepID=A0A8I0N2R5_BRUAN|nr:GNAT family N-acetyltransferase [Brucella anthropi]
MPVSPRISPTRPAAWAFRSGGSRRRVSAIFLVSFWNAIPCLLIGQLAVDRRYAGQGIGSGLVKDALRRCVAGADIVGGRAVVVRAIDADAERYWQSWDFVPSRGNPSVLMRSIQDVRLLLTDASH